jgi:hypothetical protein
MRCLRWFAVLLSGVAFAQTEASIALSNGVTLRIETNLGQPSGGEQIQSEMVPASGNSFYRIFRDQTGLAVYAYELVVDRQAGSSELQLTARPAAEAFATRFPASDGGKPTPTLSDVHSFPPLRSGGQASMDVFELAGVGVKVVDTIGLQVDAEPDSAGAALQFSGLKVAITGKPAAGPSARGVSGRYAMFYLPGKGGYFFAVGQPPGKAFVQAGSIDGVKMRFTVDNENFDCVADATILVQEPSGEVWVYHDATYKPRGNWTEPLDGPAGLRQEPQFYTAASNTLSWWIAPSGH